MTRKAVKRVIERRRQLKKQVKRKQQQTKPMQTQFAMHPQMYGNFDQTINQMRNMNQNIVYKINSDSLTMNSMKKNMETLMKQYDDITMNIKINTNNLKMI